jgi:hypothetical protein
MRPRLMRNSPGKSLPVIAQWYLAAPRPIAKYIIQRSNFALSAPAPAGKYQGVGPWGAYDMAGNVAEWRRNEAGGNSRYLLGGAWNTSSSGYFEPGGLPPFDRSANSGFRCVRNTAALPAEATAEIRQMVRDFSKAKPASDEVFRIYKAMYAYDRTLLNAKLETIEQDSTDWPANRDRIAAPSASMAVENVLAAIDIERGPTFAMQRTQSAYLVGFAISCRFPSLLFEVGEQRNPPPQALSLFAVHAECVSGIRIRRAAFQSQANRVGGRSHRPIPHSHRLSIRRCSQRRTVDGPAERSPSALSGMHSSIGRSCAVASCSACWRAARL